MSLADPVKSARRAAMNREARFEKQAIPPSMPRARHRTPQDRTDPLRDAKNQLRGARSPVVSLSEIRDRLSIGLYVPLITWLRENSFLARKYFHPVAPSSLDRLKRYAPLQPTTPDREVRWAASYLLGHGALINKYLELAHAYDQALLLGQYAEASEALAGIESNCGCSLWLLKQQVAYLQQANGLEAQKQYATEVRRLAPGDGIVPFVTYYASVRNEPTVSATRFVPQVAAELRALVMPGDLRAYLNYHIVSPVLQSEGAIADILRHEHAGSVVDYYESFLHAGRSIVASSIDPLYPPMREAVALLAGRIRDPRLASLQAQLSGAPPAPVAGVNAAYRAFSHQLRGEYLEARTLALSGLAASPADPDLLSVASTSIALSANRHEPAGASGSASSSLPEGSLIHRMVRSLEQVHGNGADAEMAITELLKLSLNFSGRPWAETAKALVLADHSPEQDQSAQVAARYVASGSGRPHPARLRALREGNERQSYYAWMKAGLTDPALALYTVTHVVSVPPQRPEIAGAGIVDEQALLMLAESHSDRGDHEQSLQLSRQLLASENAYLKRLALRLSTHSLLALGRRVECVRLIASEAARDWGVYEVVPLGSLLQTLNVEEKSELAGATALAIVYDLYQSFYDDQYDSLLHFAFDDVLDAAGVTRPSHLAAKIGELDRHELLYFLEHICVPPVMDRAVARFRNSREVLEERIAICRALIALNPEHENAYEQEIRNLLGVIMVRRRLREVEESKIYVDRDNVLRAADAALRETYGRYLAFVRHGIDVEQRASSGATAGAAPRDGLVNLPLPANEGYELLRSIVLGVRDEYVSNTAYGLDGFLSTRIRHGTLVNQLRSPLEAVQLITPRKESTNSYLPNEYWAPLFVGAPEHVQQEFTEALSDFSRRFDAFVHEVRTQWLQIRRTAGDSGMFAFMPDGESISVLSQLVTPETSFAELIYHVIALMDSLLDTSLRRIRDTLTTQAKTTVTGLLAQLQTRVVPLSAHVDLHKFNDAVATARTGLQVAIDRVAGWFHRTGEQRVEPFAIEDAIRVAEASLTSAGRHLTVHVASEDARAGGAQLRGQFLVSIVDLFFILFDNAVRYDGLRAPHSVWVTLGWQDEWITVKVRNPIAPGAMTSEGDAKLQRAREALQDRRYLGAAATEGGSGLCKVGKIIAHDFRLPPRLTFGAEAGDFVVDFALPASRLTEHSPDEG